MPRSATTTDVFNAVGERHRRRILDYLAEDSTEHAVGDLAVALGLPQPAASKHLRVLREVGLVRVRKDGRMRLYSLDARSLKAVHDWAKTFERFWHHHLGRVKAHAEVLSNQDRTDPQHKGSNQ